MGFLKRFFSAGPALNRLAKTFDECFNALCRYTITNNSDELFLAIWLFTYGIQGSIEKWHWNPYSTAIYIPNHMELGRVTINQASLIFMSSVMKHANALGIEDELTELTEQGEAFHEKSYLCSIELKNKLKP